MCQNLCGDTSLQDLGKPGSRSVQEPVFLRGSTGGKSNNEAEIWVQNHSQITKGTVNDIRSAGNR